jgi:hypothetical protein
MMVFDETPTDPTRPAISFKTHCAFRKAILPRWPKIVIDSVDPSPAPKRIAIGSFSYAVIHGSYAVIHGALAERLAAPDAQKELASSRPTC